MRTNKYDLRYGRTVSCGCYNREQAAALAKRRAVHGRSNTHEHRHWWQMVRRCVDPAFIMFERYGAQGVRVAAEWQGAQGFIRFLEHVGEAPSDKHTLDRIDGEGDYVPGNVRWATPKEQGRNRRDNRLLTAFGRTQCVAAWAEEVGLNDTTILARLKRGLSHEEAISRPLERRRRKMGA